MLITRFRCISIIGVALLAGCDAATRPASRTADQIIFVSAPVHPTVTHWHSLEKDIYRMNVDGTDPENLTRLPALAYESLALSDDGQTIAFSSDRDQCLRIWAMNVDGTNIRQLTDGLHSEVRCNRTPRWSRDASSIAFSTTREGTFSVYVMDADGSTPRNVSHPLDDLAGNTYPHTWSPDGKVVFHHFSADGEVQAYVVNPDGTEMGRFGQAGDHSPFWSPDGSMVAFIRDDGARWSLFVMSADGSDIRRLTDQPGDDNLVRFGIDEREFSPWSPDGSRIAFMNTTDAGTALDLIRADGSGRVRVVEHNTRAEFNGWTPDGRILFSSDAAGTYDVYIVNADGSALVKLTGDDTHDRNGIWVSPP